MQKISPFLWFDREAEEAAEYYVATFNGNPGSKKKSKITSTMRYDESSAKASGRPEGSILTVGFELEGESFTALNGGQQPWAKPGGFVSFVISCKTQEEIDHFWDKLGAGGETGQCGWINRDRFGVTWQIVPSSLSKYVGGKDPEGAGRAMKAMLSMTKFDIKKLKKAYEGK
jgi:predicted 3-demethylubiquinone-9 3-methyltransferase (glyoxalase superfamily)